MGVRGGRFREVRHRVTELVNSTVMHSVFFRDSMHRHAPFSNISLNRLALAISQPTVTHGRVRHVTVHPLPSRRSANVKPVRDIAVGRALLNRANDSASFLRVRPNLHLLHRPECKPLAK